MPSLSDPDDDALLELLFTEEDRMTRATADEIVRRGDALAPRLLAIAGDRALWNHGGPRGWAPIHATILLAQVKPEGAFEVVVRALGCASDYGVDLLDPWGSAVLARFADDTLEPVLPLFRDRRKPAAIRDQACLALVGLAQARSPLRTRVADALRAAATDSSESEEFRLSCAAGLLDLADPQDRAFLLSLGPNEAFDPDYVNDVYDEGVQAVTVPLDEPVTFYDPVEESGDDPGDDPGDDGGTLDDLDPDEIVPPDPAADAIEASTADPEGPPPPFRREAAKVGRNDPCPCGSGAKFKKCCGR